MALITPSTQALFIVFWFSTWRQLCWKDFNSDFLQPQVSLTLAASSLFSHKQPLKHTDLSSSVKCLAFVSANRTTDASLLVTNGFGGISSLHCATSRIGLQVESKQIPVLWVSVHACFTLHGSAGRWWLFGLRKIWKRHSGFDTSCLQTTTYSNWISFILCLILFDQVFVIGRIQKRLSHQLRLRSSLNIPTAVPFFSSSCPFSFCPGRDIRNNKTIRKRQRPSGAFAVCR